MSESEAKEEYVAIVKKLSPEFALTSGDGGARHAKSGIFGGPVFSTMQAESVEPCCLSIWSCAKAGDLAGIKNFLKSGSPTDARDIEGRTALHWAADQGHTAICSFLLSQGADANVTDQDGITPLQNAVVCERKETAMVLLAAGADSSIEDADGDSVMTLWPTSWGPMPSF